MNRDAREISRKRLGWPCYKERRYFLWGLFLLIPFVLFLAVTELVGWTIIYQGKIYEYDKKLGWVPKNKFSFTGIRQDLGGKEYQVKATTNEDGFREWGKIETDKLKIFFVGDSFTGDLNVSDEDSYYGQIKQCIDAEVFAIGCGGYGTLQEFMLVEQYIDKVKPDIFVLQFSPNDFSNNSFSLESYSIVTNQKNLRPYYVDESLVYRLPEGHLYSVLYQYSSLFRLLDGRLQTLRYRVYSGYGSSTLTPENRKTIMMEAKKTTEQLLIKLKKTVSPYTNITLSFNSSTKNKVLTEQWIEACQNAAFTPLPSVSQAVEKAEKNGIMVRTADGGHWSPIGHRIAAEQLKLHLIDVISDYHAANEVKIAAH
jgi:hypothetical protein